MSSGSIPVLTMTLIIPTKHKKMTYAEETITSLSASQHSEGGYNGIIWSKTTEIPVTNTRAIAGPSWVILDSPLEIGSSSGASSRATGKQNISHLLSFRRLRIRSFLPRCPITYYLRYLLTSNRNIISHRSRSLDNDDCKFKPSGYEFQGRGYKFGRSGGNCRCCIGAAGHYIPLSSDIDCDC